MTDVSHLQLKVDSDEVVVAEQRLNKMAHSASTAETATSGLTSMFAKASGALTRLLGSLLTLSTLVKIGQEIYEASNAVGALTARLIPLTGSAEAAAEALSVLRDMENPTKVGVEELTEAFAVLVNRGLDPSREALMSYATIARATGSTIVGVAEGVARATQGQFRELQQIGVNVDKVGNKLLFTFRGVQEEVQDDAVSIQNYITKLGQTAFPGTLEAHAKSFGGAVFDLKDAWGDLWEAITEQGIGELLAETFRAAADALNEFGNRISSGEITAKMKAFGGQFRGWRDDAKEVFEDITYLLENSTSAWAKMARSSVDTIADSFLYLPVNLRAAVKVVGEILAGTIDIFGTIGDSINSVFASSFGALITGAHRTVFAITQVLGGVDLQTVLSDWGNAVANAATGTTATFTGAVKNVQTAIQDAAKSAAQNISSVVDDWQAARGAFDAQLDLANNIADAWKSAQDARAKANDGEDPLSKANKGGDAVTNALKARLSTVSDSLRTEQEIELEAYRDRQLVLEQAWERRLLTEKDFEDKSIRNYNIFERKITEINRQESATRQALNRTVTDSAFKLASDSTSAIEQMAEKGSAMQKAAFLTGKAIAIAQTIVMTELAAISALAPPPIGLGPIAGQSYALAIRVMGYASAALIAAQSIAEVKAHDLGGSIAPGELGLVGERGPEIIRGPAQVTSTRSTADILARRSGGAQVTVNIQNTVAGSEVTATPRDTPEGTVLDIVVRRVKSELTRDLRTGGTAMVRALEGAYGLSRGAA